MNNETRLRRIDLAIKVMRRVAVKYPHQFNIRTWQGPRVEMLDTQLKHSEEEFHKCGTTACFSGWMALSPEAQAEGASVGHNGSMQFDGVSHAPGMRKFLGITEGEAFNLVSPAAYSCDSPNAYDVLNKLYKLRDKYEQATTS